MRCRLADDSLEHSVICDASWKAGEVVSGVAAVVTGQNEVRRVGASAVKFVSSVSEAEGRALVLGMKIAEDLKLRTTTFMTDSTDVFTAASRGLSKSRHDATWLEECKAYMERNGQWLLELIPRSDASFVDAIAKKARVEEWSWSARDAIPWWPELSTKVPDALCF